MRNLKKYLAFVTAMCVLLSIMLLACACGTEQTENKATTEATKASATEAKTTAATTTDEPIITRPAKTTEPVPTKVTYTVKVVGPDGEAVQNVELQLCDDAGCRLPKNTDATGTVVLEENESNYQVQINSVPTGYVLPTTKFAFPAGETTVTITLAKAN